MSDEYAHAVTGKLKLKNDELMKKKKKKKSKDKDKEKEREALQKTSLLEEMQQSKKPSMTKAEEAFKKQQEKMRNKRIMDRASTTHKQRVEKFNEHLDTLTEHFDIPKVSWTK